MKVDDLSYDQVYSLCQEFDIPGRSGMTADELRRAITEKVGDLFSDLEDISTGDQVEMNHLSSNLTITEINREDNFTEYIMETNRGGRHKLVAQKNTEVGKNGSSPHLERWRAGDEEWMNNSTDPLYIKLTAKAADIN